MNPQNSPPAGDDAFARLSPRTTPTWEIELLLSGATVFALLQLAQAVPAWLDYLLPRLELRWLGIAQMLFFYAQAALVFPPPLPLQRSRSGPATRALMADAWRSPEAAIERADNRATIVFGVGIGLVQMLATLMAAVGVLFVGAALLAQALGRPADTSLALLVLLAVWFLPYMLAMLVDRYLGDRLPADSTLRRLLPRVLAPYAWLGISREGNPLIALYSTSQPIPFRS